jgi:hypothetical protein
MGEIGHNGWLSRGRWHKDRWPAAREALPVEVIRLR